MPEGYLHLTCEQRCQIYALLQSGHSQAHIARQIGVDPSTISRELVRNTGARGYRFKQAHEKASQRREEASDKPRKMTPDLVELIEEKRFFDVSSGLEQVSQGRGDHVDHGREGCDVAISASTGPGGLEQAVEPFETGIAV